MLPIKTIRKIINLVPEVFPYLSKKVKWMYYADVTSQDMQGKNASEAHWHVDGLDEPINFQYKTYDYFLQQLNGLISGVYENNLGGDFIDIMANLISGQLTQAYQQAYEDAGYTGMFLPDYLQNSLTNMIANQYMYVDQLFRDIIDARLDGTPLAPLLARAQLWAQRWIEGYNEATRLITVEEGGNLIWVLGRTEVHCHTCSALDGIVASAREWDQIGIKPQNAPNSQLECGGWRCDCSLEPTPKRRSPDAYGRIEEALL